LLSVPDSVPLAEMDPLHADQPEAGIMPRRRVPPLGVFVQRYELPANRS
jgi:hypothetical protein